jgi:hypothetical protein
MDSETLEKIEAWFLRHFGHITPGTPDHAVATAAKNDLIASLTPTEGRAASQESES